MNLKEAKRELLANINVRLAHAVLLGTRGDYRVELHTGFVGNCLCDSYYDFLWREGPEYTDRTAVYAIRAPRSAIPA